MLLLAMIAETLQEIYFTGCKVATVLETCLDDQEEIFEFIQF